MKKLLTSSALTLALSIGAASASHAALIDNGSMLPRSGGWCSTCADLDSANYMNFDNLTLAGDSILNAIEFEIALYAGGNALTSDYRVQLRTTAGVVINTWNFNGGQVTGLTSLGSNTYTIGYDLGDYALSAGSYMLGIAADFGSHSTSAADYTPGASSDGQQYQYFDLTDSGWTLNGGAHEGDLPFRLTINESNNVPEPASMALIALGLLGLGAARRKRV